MIIIYGCQFNFISVKDVSAVERQRIENHRRAFNGGRPLRILSLGRQYLGL